MSGLQRAFFNVYFRQDEGGGGDGEMVSFEEAFGRDPFTGEATDPTPPPDNDDLVVAPEGDDDDDDDATPPTDPVAGDGAATPGSEAWRQEMLQRFPNGEGDLWKSYRELESRFSQRPPEQAAPPAAPEPPAPAPMPLLSGGIPEIKTEEDLVAVATANPRAAADFALANRDRLSDDQFNFAMNNWFAAAPFEASQALAQAQAQALREQMAEENSSRDAHYMKSMRDQGIAQAVAELPMINDYREDMATFVESNPHLTTWIEGLQTPEEVKSALHSIFYQMAGPKLSQQILEQQVAKGVAAREAAAKAEAEAAAAAEGTQKAKSQRRSTAVSEANDQSYDDQIRARILNPSGR